MNLFHRPFNVPNLISIARILLAPLLIYLLFIPTKSARIWALAVFMFASFTDMLDGWAARKLKIHTPLGAFLDPFADKMLVISTLIAFLILDPFIPLWMVLIIVGRDILITWMRYEAQKKGKPLRTSHFGKFKTAFQMGSIVIIIMIYILRKKGIEAIALSGRDVIDITLSTHPEKWSLVGPYWIMFIVTALTAFSGIRYLFTNWKLFIPEKKDQ